MNTPLRTRIRRVWSGSIHRQWVLGITLFISAVMALFVFQTVERQRDFLLRQSEERGIALAEALAASSTSWVLANDVVGLQEVVDAVRRYPDLRYVMVLAPDGRVLAHSDPGAVGRYVDDGISAALLAGPKTKQVSLRTASLIDVAVPVKVRGAHVGWARVGVGRERVTESLSDITRSGLVYGGFAIVLGGLLAAALTRGLTRALTRLVELTRKVGAGMAEVRANVGREDELGELGHAFDAMTLALDTATRELKASLEEVTDLYNHAPCGYHSLDPEGVIVRMNDTELAWLGYTREEVVGKLHISSLMTPESQIAFRESYPIFKWRGWVKDMEFEFVRKDRSTLHVLLNATSVKDAEGQLLMSRSTVYDITEKRRVEDGIRNLNSELEQRVARRTAQLEAANQELEAFAYSVSHDLRAPLRAIDGFSKILLEDYDAKLDEEGRRLLGMVSANTARMGALIDDILDFSHTGQLKLEATPVDMKILAGEVFDELQKAAPGRRLRFEVGDLPAALGDRAMLRQVLVNLLSNAIKFTQPRAEAVVEMGASAGAEETVYYVKDNGVGFDTQYADKLFGVFQRLHGSQEFEGTGIGLAIVKRIVLRHGGRVWAESKLEAGATFYFALPRTARQGE